MKTKILVLIAIICFLITNTAKAQTNYKSGFYPTLDSMYFTVNWATGPNQQIWVSVNRFSDDGYQPYTGGMWLKKRPAEINTWENILYARNPCYYQFDPLLPSGDRDKLNIIRVVLYDTVQQKMIKDSVYAVGLGPKPHLYHAFFITVDSFEFADMMNRYDEDIRIRAWLTIFSPSGKLEVSQPVEFYIAAGSSACIANKGFTVKGEDASPIFGKKNIKTSVFTGNENILIDEKKIKLRSGNGGQLNAFGVHETIQRILDYQNLPIGGVKNNIGIIYINGSYWSVTFPQRKADDERDLAAKWNTHKDSVSVGAPIPFNIYLDTLYAGCKTVTFPLDSLATSPLPQITLRQMSDAFTTFKKGDRTLAQKFAGDLKKVTTNQAMNARLSGDTTITFCGTWVHLDFSYDSVSTSFYNILGFDTVQFFPEEFLSLDKIVIVHNPDGQKKLITVLDAGTVVSMQPALQYLNDLLFNYTMLADSTDHYDELANWIDMDNSLRHFVEINDFTRHDALSNNEVFTTSNKTKLGLTGTDFDDAQLWNLNGNNWITKILVDTHSSYDGFLPSVTQMILRWPKTQERLILLYQGMLNTVFNPLRTVPIVDTMKSIIIPEYPYHYQAWGGSPNGGSDPTIVGALYDQFHSFMEQRNDVALQILTNQFQQQDSLVVSNDAHMVKIVFDSIPVNSAEVIISRDTLLHFKSNWSGKFLRKPAITFEVRSLSGFEIKVKEFIDSGSIFKINPDSTVTVTLVLRPHILPVELVSFGCSVDSLHNTRLDWSTASEINNTGFTVERSLDGIQFDSIAFVPGAGTSNQFRNYSFEDNTTLGGDVYYRIKQVDADGSYTYSDICMLSMPELITNIPEEVIVYPNPTNGIIYVKNTASIQKISVYDVLSRLVYENDSVFTEIPLGILPKGTYAIMFTLKNGEQITKKVTLF